MGIPTPTAKELEPLPAIARTWLGVACGAAHADGGIW